MSLKLRSQVVRLHTSMCARATHTRFNEELFITLIKLIFQFMFIWIFFSNKIYIMYL